MKYLLIAMCLVLSACNQQALQSLSQVGAYYRAQDAYNAQLQYQAYTGRMPHPYPGNCLSPYDFDSSGNLCGNRSAYSRSGGY